MKLYLIAALAFCFAFLACSEDNGTDSNNKEYEKYLTMIIGNYNICDAYTIDADENRLQKARSGDTVGYTHEQMIGGKNCKVLTGRDSEGNIYLAAPQYCDGTEIWVSPINWRSLVQYFKQAWGDFPFEPPADELWLLADLAKDNWEGFEKKTVTDFVVREGAVFESLSIHLVGEKTRELKIDIDGTTYDAIEFATHFNVVGKSIVDGKTTDIDGTHTEKYTFVKNVGLVNYISIPVMTDYGFGPIPVPGEEIVAVKIFQQ